MNALYVIAHVLYCGAGVSAAPTSHDRAAILTNRQNNGSLSYQADSPPFTFEYSTSQPAQSNYIGLWAASGGGPVDRQLHMASIRWEYVPDAEGTVQLTPEHLDPGEYTAFFLQTPSSLEEPAVWLADPLNVTLVGGPAALSFPVEEATFHNARRDEPYSASVGGLVLGKGGESVTFAKVDGDHWVDVKPDGTITGTPTGHCSTVSTVTIQATAENESQVTIRITIPVRNAGESLVDTLGVMSFNNWVGGSQVRNYHEKQLRFILQSTADVIGVQEGANALARDVRNRSHVERLGQSLGWHYYSSNYSTGVLSRYPIVEEYDQVLDYSGGVRINLNGAAEDVKEVNVWNTHPYPLPYGPHEFCLENSTKEEVLAIENESRGMQVKLLLDGMKEQLANSEKTPVLLLGDMNAPSHLDWTEALKEKNCGISDLDWPTSVLPIEAGLIDSYRAAHFDPVVDPGLTWSPIHRLVDPTSSEREPQDRIDFVYATKELSVIRSEALVIGEPEFIPNERDNEWTSDHKAVLTHFRLP